MIILELSEWCIHIFLISLSLFFGSIGLFIFALLVQTAKDKLWVK